MKKLGIIIFGSLLFLYICAGAFAYFVYPAPYRSFLNKYSTMVQLDPLLMGALIFTESRFQENSVSPAGAVGLTQIMPLTAVEISQDLGIKDFAQKDLFNGEINIQMGCYYLSKLKKSLNMEEQWWALAAYNAGEKTVRKWRKEASPQLTKGRVLRYKETRRYVRKIEILYIGLRLCKFLKIV